MQTATFDDVKKKLDSLPNEFKYGINATSPATEAELDAVEARVGVKFPAELRKLLRTWGVLVMDVDASVWPRPQELEVLPAWRFAYGFTVLGVGASLPEGTGLRLEEHLTPTFETRNLLPILRRTGQSSLIVLTESGPGVWSPDTERVEEVTFDIMKVILEEIGLLEAGVARLATSNESADALMQRIREAGFGGSAITDPLEALKKRPAAELVPHLSELARALLPKGTDSMACLDVIAAAGPTGFATVADEVHAHFGEGDDPYVIEVLGKMGDTSERALEIYAEGIESEDSDVLGYTLEALRANASKPEVRAFVEKLDERLDELDDPDDVYALLGTLGILGGETFDARLEEALETTSEDDEAFGGLVRGLRGLSLHTSDLATPIVERLRKMAPTKPNTFNAVEGLVELGVVDVPFMTNVALTFQEKGWHKRADALLAKLKARTSET